MILCVLIEGSGVKFGIRRDSLHQQGYFVYRACVPNASSLPKFKESKRYGGRERRCDGRGGGRRESVRMWRDVTPCSDHIKAFSYKTAVGSEVTSGSEKGILLAGMATVLAGICWRTLRARDLFFCCCGNWEPFSCCL